MNMADGRGKVKVGVQDFDRVELAADSLEFLRQRRATLMEA